MLSTRRRVMIVAGEASGDLHAADLVKTLAQRRSDCEFFGMGGSRMREAGVELLADASELAVVGLFEVLAHYPQIRRAFHRLEQTLEGRTPDLLILVDYVEFNLRLARRAKRLGIKVLFYISPQVWAWRSHRVKKIGARVDRMAVLFPFEVEFYQRHGIPVTYVGHPLVSHARPSMSRDHALQGFGLDASRPIVGLLPGSRRSEIKRLLPLLVDTAALLQARIPNAQFLLPLASTLREPDLAPYSLEDHGIAVVNDHTYDVMQVCDALIVTAGTATLEAALIGTPMAIVYKVSPLSYPILKHLIKIEHIGLPNIVADASLVKEFIQQHAQPNAIADEIARLIEDRDYSARMREALAGVGVRLSETQGEMGIAEVANEMLDGNG